MNKIAQKYSISKEIATVEDWYSLYGNKLAAILKEEGGASLLHHYSSVPNLLKTVYPELKWDDSRFKKPKNYWSNVEHQRAFLSLLSKKLSIC